MIVLILFILGSCPSDKPPIYCPNNPCIYQTCSNFPDAQCVLDNCGQCQVKFISNETDVTDQCSKYGNSNKNLNDYFHYNLYFFKKDPYTVQGTIFKLSGSKCLDVHV